MPMPLAPAPGAVPRGVGHGTGVAPLQVSVSARRAAIRINQGVIPVNHLRPLLIGVLVPAVLAGAATGARAQGCTPINAVPFTISTAGSYCLTADLTTAQSSGVAIEVAANDVVLDFQGHSLDGRGGGVSTRAEGVHALNRHRITVRNGRLFGFYIGVHLDISSESSGHIVERMTFEESRWKAIKLEGAGNIMRANTMLNGGGGGHHIDGVAACENWYGGSIEAYNNTIIDLGADEPDASPDGMMLYCLNSIAIGNRFVNVGDSGIAIAGGFCKDNVLEYVYGRPYDRSNGNGCRLVGTTNHNYP
jgi:hypothetical protein